MKLILEFPIPHFIFFSVCPALSLFPPAGKYSEGETDGKLFLN